MFRVYIYTPGKGECLAFSGSRIKFVLYTAQAIVRHLRPSEHLGQCVTVYQDDRKMRCWRVVAVRRETGGDLIVWHREGQRLPKAA